MCCNCRLFRSSANLDGWSVFGSAITPNCHSFVPCYTCAKSVGCVFIRPSRTLQSDALALLFTCWFPVLLALQHNPGSNSTRNVASASCPESCRTRQMVNLAKMLALAEPIFLHSITGGVERLSECLNIVWNVLFFPRGSCKSI